MRINILIDFKHGTQAFTKGDRVTVPDADGSYFASHGWAAEVGASSGADASAASTTLDVQDSQIGVGDSNG